MNKINVLPLFTFNVSEKWGDESLIFLFFFLCFSTASPVIVLLWLRLLLLKSEPRPLQNILEVVFLHRVSKS